MIFREPGAIPAVVDPGAEAEIFPHALGARRFRVLRVAPCHSLVKTVYAEPNGQFAIGPRIEAWAHVELLGPDGQRAREVLPMIASADGPARVVEDPRYAGVFGDIGDMAASLVRTPSNNR